MWAILFARSFPSLKPTDHESSLHSAVDSDPNGWRYKTSKLDDGGWDACPSAGKGKQSQLRLPPPFPQSLEPFNNQHNEKNNAPRNRYSRMRRHKLGNVPPMVRQAEVCDESVSWCELPWRGDCETHPEVANAIFCGALPPSLVLCGWTPSSRRISRRAAYGG